MLRGAPGFFGGLMYLRRGARFVYVEHRGLARYWIAPLVLSAIMLAVGGFYAVHEHARLASAIWAPPLDAGSALGFVHRVFEWFIALCLIAIAILTVALLSNVIAAPFNDALSEAVERIRLGRSASRFSLSRVLLDVWRTIGLELAKLALYLAVMLPLLLLNFALPGFFSALYAIAGPVLTAIFLAIDYMDWAASRRQLRVRERIAFALGHLRPVLGFGLAIELLLFVPFLNLLFMPAAVAGATLLFIDLRAEGAPVSG